MDRRSSFQMWCLLQFSKLLVRVLCLLYLFFLKHFEDVWALRVWVAGRLVLEFGPEFVVVFDVYLMMRKIFAIGERWGTRHSGHSAPSTHSTAKPFCCNTCSLWFFIVLLKYIRPSLKLTPSLLLGKHMLLLSSFIVTSKHARCPCNMQYTYTYSYSS